MNVIATLVPVLVTLFGALVAISERNTRLILKRLDGHDDQFAGVQDGDEQGTGADPGQRPIVRAAAAAQPYPGPVHPHRRYHDQLGLGDRGRSEPGSGRFGQPVPGRAVPGAPLLVAQGRVELASQHGHQPEGVLGDGVAVEPRQAGERYPALDARAVAAVP